MRITRILYIANIKSRLSDFGSLDFLLTIRYEYAIIFVVIVWKDE